MYGLGVMLDMTTSTPNDSNSCIDECSYAQKILFCFNLLHVLYIRLSFAFKLLVKKIIKLFGLV